MFSGSMVALVTPFKNGGVDWQSLEGLIAFHLQNGTNGIVPCGTTGESATLSHQEHDEVIRAVIKAVNKRSSRHRRHRLQFHRRSGSAHARSGKIRRRRRFNDFTLLQPPDPRRHLSAL